RVAIHEEGGSGREILEAEYVVGCDGGPSTVRRQIGIERGGADFNQLMVLAVFRSRELHEGLKRFPARSTYRVRHPGLKGYWQFFGRVDADGEFFFHAPVPADTTKENYDFHGLLQKAAGFTFACEFDYVGFWDLRIAVSDTYQVGRAFIAGDAAHSHPPYGAYGLNNGLDDVANLGRKLAATLAGWRTRAPLGCRRAEGAARLPRGPRMRRCRAACRQREISLAPPPQRAPAGAAPPRTGQEADPAPRHSCCPPGGTS